MKKYSEFINFPINLWASKEVEKEVPVDEDESTDEEETCMCDSSYLACQVYSVLMKLELVVNVFNAYFKTCSLLGEIV